MTKTNIIAVTITKTTGGFLCALLLASGIAPAQRKSTPLTGAWQVTKVQMTGPNARRQGQEVEAITAEGAHLPALGMVREPLRFHIRDFHESFLQIAGDRPVLADVHEHGVRHHLCASVSMSARAART